ncbi:MAG: hypothetical protein QM763_13640 [Agriterribacter sp.]
MRRKILAGTISLLFCLLSSAGTQVIARFTLHVTIPPIKIERLEK